MQYGMLKDGFVLAEERADVAARRREQDGRAADEQFVAWVLGYGYAAGHFTQKSGPRGQTTEVRQRRLALTPAR